MQRTGERKNQAEIPTGSQDMKKSKMSRFFYVYGTVVLKSFLCFFIMSDVEVLVAPIAKPLASEKTAKKLLKLVKYASKDKSIRRGVKECVKALKKGEKGLCILAGDISPIDVISHIPVLCEDNDIPYIFVPSKEALGTATQSKRSTSIIMVKRGDSYGDKYDECLEKAKSLNK